MKKQWPQVRLGEVLTQDQQYILEPELRSYPKLSVKLYGKGVVLDAPTDGSTLKMKRHQLARVGQVILSEIWGKKGAIGLVPAEGEGALCTSHFFLFNVRTNKVAPEWLQAVFMANYLQEQLDAKAKGTTGYAAVRPKTLLECEIPLPPLAEQRRVVARIEELAAQIYEARGIRSGAEIEGDTLSLAGSEVAYQLLRNRVGCQRLAAVCQSITHGDHNTPTFTETGVRFIFVGNVSSGRLHPHSSKRVSEDYFDRLSPQRVPKPGDILYSAVGATLGIPAVVDIDEPFCFQRHIAILKPQRDRLNGQFAWHMLRSRTVFETAWASTTGSAQPTIPLRAIRELPIPIPSLAEQHLIVAELDALDVEVHALRRLQAESATEIDTMLPAILDRAFQGDL
jgi:type I restriction enzyme, S subunit